MLLKQIRIRNFRSLVDVRIPLDPTTVLLGENNVGKTAVLDAIRFMLSRAVTRRGALFDEYDVHLSDETADPRASSGIIIEAEFEESQPDEWIDSASELDSLERRAAALISDEDIRKIEGFSRRTRGEIFFARCWLLCEGQSEVALLPRLAEMLGISFDSKGIALIDYQNNGSAGAFATLARAFNIPWFMFCDNDQGGRSHLKDVENHGFTKQEIAPRARQLPSMDGKDTDFEKFLVEHFKAELHSAAVALGAVFQCSTNDPEFVEELRDFLRTKKVASATLLAGILNRAGPERVPPFFVETLNQCETAADA